MDPVAAEQPVVSKGLVGNVSLRKRRVMLLEEEAGACVAWGQPAAA